jgi:hypothetical protein
MERKKANLLSQTRGPCGPVTKEVHDPLLLKPADPRAKGQGLRIHSLTQGDTLIVHTRNSTYRIIMLDRTNQMVLIRGGKHFPQPTEACLLGSTTEKKVQIGRIVLGRGLGFAVGRRCFITSPVAAIERQFLEKTGTPV